MVCHDRMQRDMTLEVKVRTTQNHERLTPNPSMMWIFKNYPKLMRDYPDKWIAVKDSKVVASGSELEPLLHEMIEKFGTTTGFAVEFIGGTTRNLLI